MTVHSDASPYWREFDAAARSLLGLAVLVAAALAAALTMAGLPAAHAQRGVAAACASCTPPSPRAASPHVPDSLPEVPSR